MNAPAIPPKRPQLWRVAVTLLLVAVLVYVLASHHSLVRQSITALARANYGWFGIALGAVSLTFLEAAGIYKILALHPIRYNQTVLIELAASFANRLLPAGLGGLGLHGLYLHRRKHTAAEATAIVSINNLLGILAHLSLLITVCLLRPQTIVSFEHHWNKVPWPVVVAAAVLIILMLALVPAIRRALAHFIANLLTSLRRLTFAQLGQAYGLSLLLTLTYTLALYGASQAIHLHLPLLQVFVVFSIGMLAGTATPTPGGLVGIEAGLYAGFISYGASMPAAAAATLVYRLLTYWLPLIPGFVALFAVRRRKLV